jgi:hypothetical protein
MLNSFRLPNIITDWVETNWIYIWPTANHCCIHCSLSWIFVLKNHSICEMQAKTICTCWAWGLCSILYRGNNSAYFGFSPDKSNLQTKKLHISQLQEKIIFILVVVVEYIVVYISVLACCTNDYYCKVWQNSLASLTTNVLMFRMQMQIWSWVEYVNTIPPFS